MAHRLLRRARLLRHGQYLLLVCVFTRRGLSREMVDLGPADLHFEITTCQTRDAAVQVLADTAVVTNSRIAHLHPSCATLVLRISERAFLPRPREVMRYDYRERVAECQVARGWDDDDDVL